MIDDVLPPWQKKPKPDHAQKSIPAPPVPDKAMPQPDATIVLDETGRPKPKRLARVRHHWYNFSRAEQVMALGGLLLIILGIFSCSLYVAGYREPKEVAVIVPAKKKVTPKPPTAEAPLTGLQVDPALVKRPVTAIMIENSLDARPQSGLQDAGIVYEAIAEGGITRFIALFQDTRPQYIGPVRSLRPYYIDFATPFDASIAHVGGSPEALSQIRNGGKDLDQFFNSGAYWRQNTRPAPHNVYTSFDRIDGLNQKKGYTTSSVQGWQHKSDQPLKSPTAKSIDLNISSYYYNVHYDYEAASNSYLRSEGGKAHMATSGATDKTGVRLKPKVVIALVMGYGLEADHKHSAYQVNGSGKLYLFQDGDVITGTWIKADRTSQFVFKDDSGKLLSLDAGQAWVSIVSYAGKVSYKP